MLKVKDIKQMQIGALEQDLEGVQEMVFLSTSKLDAVKENQIRLALRKKDILLRLVKNNFARRLFQKMDVDVKDIWEGPTMVAWGGTSLAGLSKELEKAFKDHKTIEFKGALAEREQVTFKEALEMPTKEEAIGEIVMLFLSPARRIAGQINAPGAKLAGQLKALQEKEGGGDELPA